MAETNAAAEPEQVMNVILQRVTILLGENTGLESFRLLAGTESVRVYSLLLGVFGIVTGFLLLVGHKKSFEQAMAREDQQRARVFEVRKYRRRSLVSSMVAAAGCMMAALFWVTDAKVFSVFILLILTTLLGVLGIAMIDLFSVGLNSLTRTDDAARKAMVEEYLRQRKKSAFEEPEEK